MPGRSKDHNAVALDEERLAGLGVAPQTIRSLPKFERPEPRQLDRLPIQNGLADLPCHETKSLANSLPGKIAPSSEVVSRVLDDIASIQGTPPFFFCVLFPVLECLCFFFSNGASLSCGRIKSKAVLSGRVAILKIWIPTNKQIFPQYFQAVGSMTALKPGPGEMEPDSRASGVGDASPLANMTLACRPSQNPA